MSSDSVDAVVFDLGGVITGSAAGLLAAFAEEAGVPFAAFAPTFSDGYPGLADMELGITPLSEYLVQVCGDIGRDHGVVIDSVRFAECIHDSLHPVAAMVGLVAEVRHAHRTAILTNNNPELTDFWRPRLPADFVDVIVDSSVIGKRKPDRSAYQHAADALGVELDRSVFVDDTAANIDGALACGMRAVLFRDPVQCRHDLIAAGVHLRPYSPDGAE